MRLLSSSTDGVRFCGLKLSLIGSDGEETEETEEKDVVAFRDVERGVNQRKISWEMMVICKRSEQGRWVEMSM